MKAIWRFLTYIIHHAVPVWLKERKRWRLPAAYGCPRVFYGFETISGQGEFLHGGLVKVQDLLPHFPNEPDQANILYLVSSAYPKFAPGFAGKFLPLLAVLMVKYAKRAGIKVVLNQDGVAYAGWYGKGWKKANRPYRKILKAADYVFYQTEFAKMSADRFLCERHHAWSILPNAVNTLHFIPLSVRPVRPCTLLVTGSHYSIKRISLALSCLRILKEKGLDARLRVAGRFCWGSDENDARAEIENLMSMLNIDNYVKLLGPYTQQEAVNLYQSADILMHLKYNDPCPRVVLEAMSCGLPVVYSGSGGLPEMVGSGAGVGIPQPLDWEREHYPKPMDLAEAVIRIFSNLSEYSRRARGRVEAQFDVANWVDRHAAVFKDLAGERAS